MSDNQELDIQESDNNVHEDYDKLNKIGAQRIHEQTHIPKVQCEDLVNGYFESMNKIQFLGFVSILEREYSLDLSGLKSDGIAFFEKKEEKPALEESKVFVTPKKTRSYTLYYALAAIIIFLIVVVGIPSSDKKQEPKIDNKHIEQVASKIIPQKAEEPAQEIEEPKPEPKVVKEFKIIPMARLWVGYINLDTGRKYQKIVELGDELSLEPDTHWLLSLGHGHVNFNVNGELDKYVDPRNIRLVYKNGELKKIRYKEFLDLNKGKEW